MRRALKWLSVYTTVGMFFVLLGGALVTKTGSGLGCGKEWPLCNGKFVPAYTLESLIEYSHRAVSGIVGILVLLLAILVFWQLRRSTDAKAYAMIALFFTMLQGALGALAVLWQQSSAVLALHFGFSLLAFAGTLLLMIEIWRELPPESGGLAGKKPRMPVSGGYRNLVWFIASYTYAVVYLGAFVRHTDSMGGCTGWPLCNGEAIPELTGATGVVFIHRLAAALLFVLILGMFIVTRRKYGANMELLQAASAVMLLVALQVLSGAWVTLTVMNDQIYIFASLLHTTIISLLFGALCYLSVLAWRLGGGRTR